MASVFQSYFVNLMYVLCFVTGTKVRISNNQLGYQTVALHMVGYQFTVITYYDLIMAQLNEYQEFNQSFAVYVFKNAAKQAGLCQIFPVVDGCGQLQVQELESKMLDYQRLKNDYNVLVQQYNQMKAQFAAGGQLVPPNMMQPMMIQNDSANQQQQQQIQDLTKENGQLKLKIVELEGRCENT